MLPSTALRILFPFLALAAVGSTAGAQVACEPGISGVMSCPCANSPSGLIRGCNNSLNTGGARMVASGSPSISNDQLGISSLDFGSSGPTCSGIVLNPLCVLYQGTTGIATGQQFGDGVLCTGGNVILLSAKPATNGTFRYPEAPTDPSISVLSASLGDPLSSGSIRHYFVAYRDNCPSFCVPSFRNKSNSWVVTWVP
jgi:hypothetical protein